MSDIRIAAQGLTEWERSFLQATVEIASGTDIARWSYQDESAGADVLLVGSSRYPHLEAPGNPRVVVLTDVEADLGRRSLSRPLIYSRLVCLLRSLENELRDRESLGIGGPELRSETTAGEAALPVTPNAPLASASLVVTTPSTRNVPAVDTRGDDTDAPSLTDASARPAPDEEPLTISGNIQRAFPQDATTAPNTMAGAQAAAAPVDYHGASTHSQLAAPLQPTPAIDPADASGIRRSVASLEVSTALARMSRRTERFFEGTRILGLIQRVIESERIANILHPRFEMVSVYPGVGLFTSRTDLERSPDLFRAPASEFTIQVVPRRESRHFSCTPGALSTLLYLAALLGGEGRLPAVGEPNDILTLLRMPNFSKLPQAPEHVAIAVELAKGPTDLRSLTLRTGIALTTVIDVVSAFEVAHLLRRAPAPPMQRTERAASTGTFARLPALTLDPRIRHGRSE